MLTGLLASYLAGLAAREQDPALKHARKLLSRTLLIDGHNDVPWAIRNDSGSPTGQRSVLLGEPRTARVTIDFSF